MPGTPSVLVVNIPSDMMDHVEPLRRWFAARLEAAELEVVAVRPVSGGLVNHVGFVDVRRRPDARSERFLIRVDPVTGPYAPYDMPAQYDRFVRLHRAGLRVPRPLFLETDRSVVGREFWISEFVEGETPGRLLDLDTGQGTRRLHSYVAALADIHATDWQAAGLERRCPPLDIPALRHGLAAPGPELDRLEAADRALFEATATRLRAMLPSSFPMRLTHGDCSLSNYIYRGADVAAVVDWDLARITDPVSDLGYYCAIHHRFQMALPRRVRRDRLVPVIDAYAAGTGEDIASLPFWEMFHSWTNALSWLRPGWGKQASGFSAYRDRLCELLHDD